MAEGSVGWKSARCVKVPSPRGEGSFRFRERASPTGGSEEEP